MKKFFLLLFAIGSLVSPASVAASPTTISPRPRVKLYSVTVRDTYRNKINEGILYGYTDSTLLLVPDTPKSIKQLLAGSPDVKSFSYDRISKISIQRKGHIMRSLLIVTGIGVGVAVLVATATSYKPNAPFFDRSYSFGTALLNAGRALTIVGAAPVGMGVGALVGINGTMKLNIHRNRDTFKAMLPALQYYLDQDSVPAAPDPLYSLLQVP